MIYRILVDCRHHTTTIEAPEVWISYPWPDPKDGRLGGPGYGRLADIMDECRIFAPNISNRRAKFFFTEKGWRTAGRHVAAEARRIGHTVKVIRQKNPERSQVVFTDGLQMAILQQNGVDAREGGATTI